MEDMQDYFTHKTIKKIPSKPTREDIKLVQDKTSKNAAGTPCELGGGSTRISRNHNVECTAQHIRITGHDYTPTPNPGPVPTIPPNATQHQIAAAQDLHKKNKKLHKEEQNVARALKNQIVNAFEEQCLYDLKEEHVGHSNKSIPQIFKYLYDNYGKITDTDLLENKENMNQDWDPENPVQNVFKQIEDGAKFAELGA